MGKYDLSKEAAETDEELSNIISKLGVLSDDRMAELLPNRTDQEELKRLIKAVNQATSENQKKAVLSDRLGTVSAIVKDVALKLI